MTFSPRDLLTLVALCITGCHSADSVLRTCAFGSALRELMGMSTTTLPGHTWAFPAGPFSEVDVAGATVSSMSADDLVISPLGDWTLSLLLTGFRAQTLANVTAVPRNCSGGNRSDTRVQGQISAVQVDAAVATALRFPGGGKPPQSYGCNGSAPAPSASCSCPSWSPLYPHCWPGNTCDDIVGLVTSDAVQNLLCLPVENSSFFTDIVRGVRFCAPGPVRVDIPYFGYDVYMNMPCVSDFTAEHWMIDPSHSPDKVVVGLSLTQASFSVAGALFANNTPNPSPMDHLARGASFHAEDGDILIETSFSAESERDPLSVNVRRCDIQARVTLDCQCPPQDAECHMLCEILRPELVPALNRTFCTLLNRTMEEFIRSACPPMVKTPAPAPASHSKAATTLRAILAGTAVVAAAAIVGLLAVLGARRGCAPCCGSAGGGEGIDSGVDSLVLQRFQPVRKLGRGSYGVVYLVRRRTDGALVALKNVACASDEDQEEALQEFRTMRTIGTHPNLINVIETFMSWAGAGERGLGTPLSPDLPNPESVFSNGEGGNRPLLSIRRTVSAAQGENLRYVCIVMPYFESGDLRQWEERRGESAPMTDAMLHSFAAQLCSAMDHLHSQRPPLMHRDLKPENVLVADGGRRLVITDFGLARRLESTYCETRAGTLEYLAPESWNSHYGVEADMWGIGCILNVLVTRALARGGLRHSAPLFVAALAGRRDFRRELYAEIRQRGFSPHTADVVSGLLNPDVKARLSAASVLRLLGGSAELASPRHAADHAAGSPPRNSRNGGAQPPDAAPAPSELTKTTGEQYMLVDTPYPSGSDLGSCTSWPPGVVEPCGDQPAACAAAPLPPDERGTDTI
eukprot:TRINITY_DN8716_c0_g1_i1.p1 TRINITY_DN8716_c0_g1~~TRINITY_DN8716_c0_g1_i1.p1  ORF type:complete len:881 (+),score=176.71 TRINITY_DN8716_c0_g1_i1:72-2645(+)